MTSEKSVYGVFHHLENITQTLASYFNDRYLSSADALFLELVEADLDHYLQSVTEARVLLFPPVSSYHRLLIHNTVQSNPDLYSFSIGQGDDRRTVVCLYQALLRGPKGRELMSSPNPPLSRGRGRGRGRITDRSSPSPVGRLEKQPEPDKTTSSHKTHSTRTRSKRPEIQLYVPRGRRQETQTKQNVEEKSVPIETAQEFDNDKNPAEKVHDGTYNDLLQTSQETQHIRTKNATHVSKKLKTEENTHLSPLCHDNNQQSLTTDINLNTCATNTLQTKLSETNTAKPKLSETSTQQTELQETITADNIEKSEITSVDNVKKSETFSIDKIVKSETFSIDKIVKSETFSIDKDRNSETISIDDTVELETISVDNSEKVETADLPVCENTSIALDCESSKTENLKPPLGGNNKNSETIVPVSLDQHKAIATECLDKPTPNTSGSLDSAEINIDILNTKTHDVGEISQTHLTGCIDSAKINSDNLDTRTQNVSEVHKSHTSMIDISESIPQNDIKNIEYCYESDILSDKTPTISDKLSTEVAMETVHPNTQGHDDEECEKILEDQFKTENLEHLPTIIDDSSRQVAMETTHQNDVVIEQSTDHRDKECDKILEDQSKTENTEENCVILATDNNIGGTSIESSQIPSECVQVTSKPSEIISDISDTSEKDLSAQDDMTRCGSNIVIEMDEKDDNFSETNSRESPNVIDIDEKDNSETNTKSCKSTDGVDKNKKDKIKVKKTKKKDKGRKSTDDGIDSDVKNSKLSKTKKKDKSKSTKSVEINKKDSNLSEISEKDKSYPSTYVCDMDVEEGTYTAKANVDGEDEDEEEGDSWDKMFDDNGDCLEPSLIEELTSHVGDVQIDKPKIDYLAYQPKDPDISSSEYQHLIEIYDFPSEFVTRDLLMAFKQYMNKGFDIKWVDDTHAIGVFASTIAAQDAVKMMHPLFKVRPIEMASKQSKLKAKRSAEFLMPYKERPKTTAMAARRLVSGALGLTSKISKEKSAAERSQLREAKDKRKTERKLKKDIWEGKCAMDDS